jgi:hypothetical protein
MFRYFVVISIFLTVFISSYVFFKQPFEAYISYLAFVIFFPVFFSKFGIPKWPVIIFIPILIVGIAYCAAGFNTYTQFFKIFIGFFASVLFYHYVIQVFDFHLSQLYGYYMKGAFIVSVIGIFQLLSYYVGFKPGYNYTWLFNKWGVTQGGLGIRVNSVFSEPAYFAAVIAPAFFASLYNLLTRNTLWVTRYQSIAIVIAYFLTFSSLGIIGIFLAILLFLLNLGFFRYAIIFVPIFIFSFDYAYKNVPEFTDRWDGTFTVFQTGEYRSYDIHGSSFVLYNNYHVALENFKRHPLFGTGLGSHPIAFDKYSLTLLEGAVDIDFNKMDANSMALRLMSETGLYGLIIMFFILFKAWVFKQRAVSEEHWVMSNGMALIIILYLLRQGHYFLNGFPFFIWLYYYNFIDNKMKRKAAIAERDEELRKQLTTDSSLAPE